jgi:hypothetical protein
MIVGVSLRLLYLIFDRLLGWLLLLGRTPASVPADPGHDHAGWASSTWTAR